MANIREKRITELLGVYHAKKSDSTALLDLLDESEIPERVYNSNAIENSTLTLAETEKILLELEISRKISLREAFEAKNLALVYGYVKKTAPAKPLGVDMVLLLHRMLMTNINDEIGGRFRQGNEMVRVGTHIAVPPEFVSARISESLATLDQEMSGGYLRAVASFHTVFENIHPFVDGNGRIGRVLNNYLLIRNGLPPIIVRNKEKNAYYDALSAYDRNHNVKPMLKVFELALLESLHKRIAYMQKQRIVLLSEYAEKNKRSFNSLLNSARHQNISAFREKGVWKIGVEQ